MRLLVYKDGEERGPFTAEEIEAALKVRSLAGTDLVRKEGLGGWRPIHSVFGGGRAWETDLEEGVALAADVGWDEVVVTPRDREGLAGTADEAKRALEVDSDRDSEVEPRKSAMVDGRRWVAGAAGVVLLGWLGVTWMVGGAVRTAVEKEMVRLEANPPLDGMRVSLDSYRRGLFSSRAVTGIAWEGEEAGRLVVRHDLYHGPLALTDRGPVVGRVAVRSRLDRGEWSERFRAGMSDAFGEEEPVTVRGLGGLRGERIVDLEVGEADLGKLNGWNGRFEGGTARLRREPGSRSWAIEAEVARLDVEEEKSGAYGKLGRTVVTASLDLGTRLEIALQPSGMRWRPGKGEMVTEVESGSVVVEVELGGHRGTDREGNLGMEIPELRLRSGSRLFGTIQGISLHGEMSLNEGRVSSLARLEAGGLKLAARQRTSFDGFLGRGAVLEVEAMGVPEAVVSDLGEALVLALGQEVGMAGEGDSAAPAGHAVLGAIGPGTEWVTRLRLGGSDAELDGRLRWTGSRGLAEMGTLGEVLQAIQCDLRARMGGSMLENELIDFLVRQQAEMGVGVLEGGEFRLEASVRDGGLYFGAEPRAVPAGWTDALEAPIDWERFMAALGEIFRLQNVFRLQNERA